MPKELVVFPLVINQTPLVLQLCLDSKVYVVVSRGSGIQVILAYLNSSIHIQKPKGIPLTQLPTASTVDQPAQMLSLGYYVYIT